MEHISEKPIYIVVSQTGTMLSRILKLFTHKEYNHASISLFEDLHIMYSFGRKNPYNPFFAGFVKESAKFGTFKRFSETRVMVLKLNISSQKFAEVEKQMDFMVNNPKNYGYNYWGLWLAAFKIRIKSERRFYCSEFVRELLLDIGIDGADKLKPIVHPMNFLEIPNIETIYMGKLSEYSVRDMAMI